MGVRFSVSLAVMFSQLYSVGYHPRPEASPEVCSCTLPARPAPSCRQRFPAACPSPHTAAGKSRAHETRREQEGMNETTGSATGALTDTITKLAVGRETRHERSASVTREGSVTDPSPTDTNHCAWMTFSRVSFCKIKFTSLME